MLTKLKQWAKQLKNKLTALYYAQQHPATPWYCKALIFLTLLYALSPIDLIPDFIPLLGILDDLLLLPLAIHVAVKLLPMGVWQASEAKAALSPLRLPAKRAGIVLVFIFWLILILMTRSQWERFLVQYTAGIFL
jgi:uncharacterized membrane protein YkvA (DUF1232 family)